MDERLPRVLNVVLRWVGLALGSRAEVVLIYPDGSRLRYAIRLYFLAMNNAAEYEALINGLRIAVELWKNYFLI